MYQNTTDGFLQNKNAEIKPRTRHDTLITVKQHLFKPVIVLQMFSSLRTQSTEDFYEPSFEILFCLESR